MKAIKRKIGYESNGRDRIHDFLPSFSFHDMGGRKTYIYEKKRVMNRKELKDLLFHFNYHTSEIDVEDGCSSETYFDYNMNKISAIINGDRVTEVIIYFRILYGGEGLHVGEENFDRLPYYIKFAQDPLYHELAILDWHRKNLKWIYEEFWPVLEVCDGNWKLHNSTLLSGSSISDLSEGHEIFFINTDRDVIAFETNNLTGELKIYPENLEPLLGLSQLEIYEAFNELWTES